MLNHLTTILLNFIKVFDLKIQLIHPKYNIKNNFQIFNKKKYLPITMKVFKYIIYSNTYFTKLPTHM